LSKRPITGDKSIDKDSSKFLDGECCALYVLLTKHSMLSIDMQAYKNAKKH
jgi:hypothetical protein